MNAAAIYRSGSVRRWHANPDLAHTGQTLADHHGRCVQLLLALCPEEELSLDLIVAVAHHDVAERWVGDLPWPFKAAFPEVAEAHAAAEAAILVIEAGVDFSIDPREVRWLKLVDRLDAYLYAATHAPHVVAGADWAEAREEIVRAAWGLGPNVAPVVAKLIEDVEARRG